jgi:membrane protease YdiL (CAAX protease family)
MAMTTLPTHQTGIRGYAVRRPVTALLTVVLATGVPLLTLAAAADMTGPVILLIVYGGLAGGSLVITRWAHGPAGVRELLGRLVRWRFGIGQWLTIILAMPLLTIGVAAVTGTLITPERGWAYETGRYLFLVFIFGALLLNLAEELGWMGFVQSRLMDRRGALVGSALTAIPFAVLHLPLAFEPGWTWSSASVELLAIVGLAPFLRYLLGALYLDTAGSLLAVGLMHASYNAAGTLGAVDGGWQYLAALGVLTVVMAVPRRRA